MGAWGSGTFDNDSAADFAHEFEDLDRDEGIALITDAIASVFDEEEYLDSDIAVDALVACEALARLGGQGGEQSPYSETLDTWVAQHPGPPTREQVEQGLAAIDRILGEQSELPELWEGAPEWIAAMADLRKRVAAAA